MERIEEVIEKINIHYGKSSSLITGTGPTTIGLKSWTLLKKM